MNISVAKAIGLLLFGAAVGAVSFIPSALAPKAAMAAETPAAQAVDVAAPMKDRVLGRDDAPITIIEYASMTCDHCAAFHNRALPDVKKQLIETGKARLVYRDMPWDGVALKAAKLARCAPEDKYFEVVETIFRTHDTWAHGPDPLKGLKDIAAAAGMDEKRVQDCLASEPLELAIVQKQQEGRRVFGVNSTPYFVFMKAGERQQRYPEFEEIFRQFATHTHKH